MGEDHGVAQIGLVLALVAVLLLYALTAQRLGRLGVTAPMLFVAVGVLIGDAALGWVAVDPHAPWFLLVSEMTLALLLFADAARMHLRKVGSDRRPALRLLLLGFPLAVVVGAVIVMAVFPERGWVAALLLAAILAPTDAGLGASFFDDSRVPLRVRRMLAVESGLNDGVAAPLVTVLIAVAAVQAGLEGDADLRAEAGRALLFGVGAGVAVGVVGALVLRWCRARGWTSALSAQVAVLALAVLSYLGAGVIGGNGFVGAFVGGLALAAITGGHREGELGYTEASGLVLSYVVWLAFGAALVGPALGRTTIGTVVVAVGVLTIGRLIPVAVALAGERWSGATVAVVGWFGPRGLATVIFALVALETLGATALADHVLDVASITVLLSILVHGFSARSLAGRYGRWAGGLPPDAPELQDVAAPSWRRLGLHSPER